MKTFTCLKCGGKYIPKQGTLKDLEFCGFILTVKDVEYYECEKCGRLLFSSETAEKIEKEFSKVKKEEGCKACKYSYSGYFKYLKGNVCIHNTIIKYYPKGRILNPDFKIPSWCPLLKGVKT